MFNVRTLFARTVSLPTTEDEFNFFISRIVKRYKLPNWDHAAAVIANRIMHLPPDQATTTEKYLAGCVLKNIAYQVAQARGSRIAHHAQIDELIANLKADPNNQQSRDQIQKAANDGSEYAKARLAEFDKPKLTAVPTVEEVTSESIPVDAPAQG